MNPNLSVSALVLRRADYKDYDRMVTLLTAEQGKVDAVVRGCRRPKSELMNAAEPFVCGQYQLYFAHDRYSVDQYKVTDGFLPLRADMDKLMLAGSWLRVAEKIAPEEVECRDLFDLMMNALSYLTYSELPPQLVDAMFKLKLSRIQGFSPRADACAVCGIPAGETTLRFDAKKGGCVCMKCAPHAKPLSEGARRILLKAPKAPFKSIELLNGHPDWIEAAQRIDEAVRAYIGNE